MGQEMLHEEAVLRTREIFVDVYCTAKNETANRESAYFVEKRIKYRCNRPKKP